MAFSPLLLLLLAAFASTPASTEYTVNLLRPRSGSSGESSINGVSCQSWRLAVETNNIRGWSTIPKKCADYVGNYMLGSLYRDDSRAVIEAALDYAKNVTLAHDGKDVWIFDVDETTLSNLPYYASHGFGSKPYDPMAFNEWVEEGTAPPLPETLKLYKKLLRAGIKPVFITGRGEASRKATETNLRNAGYGYWDVLILRSANVSGSAMAYKSKERRKMVERKGYRIVGNIGDQWSDLLGDPEGGRTFKLPDPMYYIA